MRKATGRLAAAATAEPEQVVIIGGARKQANAEGRLSL